MTELEVDIVAARLSDSVFTDKLRARGVQFYELSGSTRHVAENCRRFRTLLQERHYDVVHLNAFQGLSLSYLHIAKEENVPVRIAHSHNTALRKTVTRPLKLAVHSLAREKYTKDATALWACSGDAARFLFAADELSRRGFQFVPNGIDVEHFRYDPVVREAVRHELGIEGKFVIGHVGRLCYQKNQSFLLDVLAEIVKRRPESVLLLVGEGEDRPKLEEKAQRLGIADRVLLYGASDHVERLYGAMDVFVMPSRFEGLPVAAIEAQAAGLHCILSREIAIECAVTERVQFISLTESIDRWRDALVTSYEPDDRAAEAGYVLKAGFDVTNIVSLFKDGYVEA